MLQIGGVFLVAVWLLCVATAQTLGGWIHALPVVVLATLLARMLYAQVTLD
jgi:dipeptide/tripeptide permease